MKILAPVRCQYCREPAAVEFVPFEGAQHTCTTCLHHAKGDYVEVVALAKGVKEEDIPM